MTSVARTGKPCRHPHRALFATWLPYPCTTPAPSTASMLGSAGGFLASPVPCAAETLPAIVCPAADHLGPAETAATLRLLRRQGWRPSPTQLCAVGSRRRISLGCGMGDPLRLRHHLDDHCSGQLSGSVPQEYLDAHSLDVCTVCGFLVKRFYNGSHPRCRPVQRGQAARPGVAPAAVADPDLPTFADVLAASLHLPRGWSCSCSPGCVAEPATARNLVRPPGAGACVGLTVSGWSYGRTVCLSRAGSGPWQLREGELARACNALTPPSYQPPCKQSIRRARCQTLLALDSF